MNERIIKLRIAAICFMVGSAGAYIGAILGCLHRNGSPEIFLCAGSAALCIGAALLNRLVSEVEFSKESYSDENTQSKEKGVSLL